MIKPKRFGKQELEKLVTLIKEHSLLSPCNQLILAHPSTSPPPYPSFNSLTKLFSPPFERPFVLIGQKRPPIINFFLAFLSLVTQPKVSISSTCKETLNLLPKLVCCLKIVCLWFPQSIPQTSTHQSTTTTP